MSGRWDNKQEKLSDKLVYTLYGLGGGFIAGMIYTLIVLANFK